MPYTVENALTDAGDCILGVAEMAEAWLGRATREPMTLGDESARVAIKTLIAGWGSGILRALATTPLSLTQLDEAIPGISYPSLERRLSAMRAVGLVEALPERGTRRPCVVTSWTRRAVGLLAGASRCERAHVGSTAEPSTDRYVEAALLLATPLVRLPVDCVGSCSLAVIGGPGDIPAVGGEGTGVCVEVEAGTARVRTSDFRLAPSARVAGDASAWLDAIVTGCGNGIEVTGEGEALGHLLVGQLHVSLRNLRGT
jgi:DNA-binding HxlR family transcriptional regulator